MGTRLYTQNTTLPAPSFTPARGGVLQRKCRCGGSAVPSGECLDCNKKRKLQTKLIVNEPGDKYEVEADRVADSVIRMSESDVRLREGVEVQVQRKGHCDGGMAAPPIVDNVLRSPGQPLDPATRAFMEPRFNHDFSRVRVHTDAQSVESAQAVNAIAYTVGQDIVFGSGQYSPGTVAGQHVLSHELVHVIQQGGGPTSPISTRHEPDSQVVRNANRSGKLQAKLSGVDIRENGFRSGLRTFNRIPDSGLSPSGNQTVNEKTDNSGTITGSLQRSMNTPMDVGGQDSRYRGSTLPYREATELMDCIRIMGEENATYCRQEVLGETPLPCIPQTCEPAGTLTWTDFTGTPGGGTFGAETRFHFDFATDCSRQIIRAFFDGSSSWVRSRFANPTDPALSGCAGNVTSCEQFFDTETVAGRTGGTWRLGAPVGCAASIGPNPAVVATTKAECGSLIEPECTRVAQLESERLLAHEQLHFRLACVMASKGTDALSAAHSNQANTILTAVRNKTNTATSLYDVQTAHGCNAASQATWTQSVDDGLPAILIP